MSAIPIVFKPIGFIRSPFAAVQDTPHQPQQHEAVIELEPHCNYEQALLDLEGFERIWVLWFFDKVRDWKPKILPPRDVHKHGVFATRSPHRPNPLAMSVVELLSITKCSLRIRGADMLDGTPVIDIKPYIPEHDSFPASRAGWTDVINARVKTVVQWLPRAVLQAEWIEERTALPLRSSVTMRLEQNHTPSSYNRIEHLHDTSYRIAYKEWRLLFSVQENTVTVKEIHSAYSKEALASLLVNNPTTYSLHQEFCTRWKLSAS